MATIEFGDPTFTEFILDETEGLQDDDILRSTLAGLTTGEVPDLGAAFDALLTSLGFDAFANDGRIAASSTDLYTVSPNGSTITGISLAGYDNGDGTAVALVGYDSTANGGLGNFTDGGSTGGWTTTDDEAIRLFSDYNGMVSGTSLEGNVAFGVDASGDLVFAILMIERVQADGSIDLQFVTVTGEALQHDIAGNTDADYDDSIDLGDFLSLQIDETSGFNFLGVPPGKSMHLTAASTSGDGSGVIVTPLTEVVQINTSNAFPDGVIGYGSQGINEGESVVVTWVESGLVPDLTIPDLDQNEADLASNIRFDNLDSVAGASFTIQQKVGSKVAAVSMTALATNSEDGTGSGDYFDHVGNTTFGTGGDDTIVQITSVTLFQNGVEVATLTGDGTFAGTSITADFADLGGVTNGQVIVTGIDEGDEFRYTTLTDTERLVVTGVSGNVDIGGFSTVESGSFAQAIGDAIVVDDDGPSVTVTVAADTDGSLFDALSRNLDETIDPANNGIDGFDNYRTVEGDASKTDVPDNNGDSDDTGFGPSYAEAPANAMGSLTTTAGQLAALFGTAADFVDYGTDGEGDFFSGGGRDDGVKFSLTGTQPVKTNLVATPVVGSALAGLDLTTDLDKLTVYLTLNEAGTVLEGRIKGPDGEWGGGDDYLIVRMTLNSPDDPAKATITYEQFAPVQNPDPNLYDEPVFLKTVNEGEFLDIVWTTTAYDGDDDYDSDSNSVTLIDNTKSVFSIDDDGPQQAGSPDDVLLWEDGLTALGGLTDNDGEAEAVSFLTGDLSTQVNAGSDGIKSIGLVEAFESTLDALGLTSGGVALSHDITVTDGDDTLIATANGTEIYRVTVSEDGKYSVRLSGTLDHDVTDQLLLQPDEDEIIIDLTGGLYATEGDNDPAPIQANALRLVIEDDAVEFSGLDDTTDALAFDDSSTFTDTGFVGFGADGPASTNPLVISNWTATLITGDEALGTVTGSLNASGDLIYTSSEIGDIISISVDVNASGVASYTLNVLQDEPLIEKPLIDGATTPGGPVETFDLPPGGPTFVTFDGYIFTDAATTDQAGQFAAGDYKAPADDIDDVNISNRGAALKDNQFDEFEGLKMIFAEDVAGAKFIIEGGTGGAATGTIYVTGYNDGVFVSQYDKSIQLPKGSSFLEIDYLALGDVDEIYITHDFEAPNGFRIPEIYAFSYADIPDLTGTVTLTATDGDFDTAVDSFDFFIDGSDADSIYTVA